MSDSIHEAECSSPQINNQILYNPEGKNKKITVIYKNENYDIERNDDQTLKLFDMLLAIFPRNEKEVKEILNKYPACINIDKLIDKLLIKFSRYA